MTNRAKYTALIVDDEALAREKLRLFFTTSEEFEVLDEATNGADALSMIQMRCPDLVLVDVKMPGMSGPELIQKLDPKRCSPVVVFTTAFSDFAVQAFALEATDYLVKPFSLERFRQCLTRVRDRIRLQRLAIGSPVVARPADASRYRNDLLLRTNGKIVCVSVSEIRYVSAEGNYVRFHLPSESTLIRCTMNSVQAALDPNRFVRIHRSAIVNVTFVKEFRPWLSSGSGFALLRDGTRLPASRGFMTPMLRSVELG
jgi:two-component system LytT family response regulator